MRWVDGASGEARDAMLSEVAGVSLRRGRIAFRNWEPSSRPAIKCVRVIESAHPYLPATDMEVRAGQQACMSSPPNLDA